MRDQFNEILESTDVEKIKKLAVDYTKGKNSDIFKSEKLLLRAIELGDTSVFMFAASVISVIVTTTRVTIASYSDSQYERINKALNFLIRVKDNKNENYIAIQKDLLREKAICNFFEGQEKSNLQLLNDSIEILSRFDDTESFGYLGLALFAKINKFQGKADRDEIENCFYINKKMAYKDDFTQWNLALLNLTMLYAQGIGCEQNIEEAYSCAMELKNRGTDIEVLINDLQKMRNAKHKKNNDKKRKISVGCIILAVLILLFLGMPALTLFLLVCIVAIKRNSK